VGHLYLFGVLIAVILGVLVSQFIHFHLDRNQSPIGKPLFYYSLSCASLSAAYFVSHYGHHNIPFQSNETWGQIFRTFSQSFYFLSECAIVWFLWNSLQAMKPWRFSKTVGNLLLFCGLGFGLAYLVVGVTSFTETYSEYAYFLDGLWELGFNGTIILFLGVGIVKGERSFSWLNLMAFLPYLAPNLVYYGFGISFGHFTDPFVLTYLCVVPWIWIRFFKRGGTTSLDSVGTTLPSLADWGISDREKELIELIEMGKPNREIADIMHISSHTVKNHLYNIYRKLGVKNRTELVHFIHCQVTSGDPSPARLVGKKSEY